jgi:AcrR family transcriptional regulator
MAKLKTRDLILDVALELFNTRGEINVNSVDLAMEMNISPGNLYYHYKGKEEVVEELYARFHASLVVLMDEVASFDEELDLQAMLVYLRVVAKLFDKYSFIGQNALSISSRYTSIRRPLSKALNRLQGQIRRCVQSLAIDMDNKEDLAEIMSNNLLNTLLNLPGSISLMHENGPEADIESHMRMQLLPLVQD